MLGDALPMVNATFRAYRYPKDHPAFKGRDLTPKGTITERAAQGVDVYKSRPQGQGNGGGKGQGGRGGGSKGGGKGGGKDGDRKDDMPK